MEQDLPTNMDETLMKGWYDIFRSKMEQDLPTNMDGTLMKGWYEVTYKRVSDVYARFWDGRGWRNSATPDNVLNYIGPGIDVEYGKPLHLP